MMILSRSDSYGDFFWPTLVVMFFIAILIGGIAVSRKYLFKQDEPEHDPMSGFDIGSLRSLVKQGKMTQEEYEAAKTQIVTAAQRSAEKKSPIDQLPSEKKLGPKDPI